jgi:hypothetical protein
LKTVWKLPNEGGPACAVIALSDRVEHPTGGLE